MRRLIPPILVGLLVVIAAAPVEAANATWNTTTAGSSEYWTNSSNWSATHPGSSSGNTASITNAAAGSYTNILDYGLAFPVNILVISNRLGEAWLKITNSTLITTTGTLGGNGKIQILSGGMLTNSGNLTIGNAVARTNAVVEVIGGAAGAQLSVAGTLRVGSSAASNRLSVVDGGVLVANTATIGFGGNNNLFTLLNGASFTNSGTFGVGTSGGTSNRAYIGGVGGAVFASIGAQVHIGAGGGNWNQVIVSNAMFLVGNDRLFIGNGGGASNELHVLKDGTINAQNNLLLVGDLGASGERTAGNQLLVNGGGVSSGALVTNASSLTIGRAYFSNTTNAYNSVTVTNGGYIQINGDVVVGRAGNASALTAPSSTGNELLATGQGSELDVGGNLILGQTTHVGHSTTSNRVVVSNGALVTANSVTVGLGGGVVGSSNNYVLVQSGGVLQAHTLVTGGSVGSGNIISNFGGVFQFTNTTPVITPGTGAGSIAIDGGTISFRAISTADIGNNLGSGALSDIRFAGENTFMLNAASNTTVGQAYTFATGQPNGPSNYVHLVLINDHTAYRGGGVTIGETGSLLVSNTTANFASAFTNAGTARFVQSTSVFASTAHMTGTNILGTSHVTFNGLTGTGILTNGSGTSRILSASGNTTYAGSFRGTGLGLTVNGGTLNLTGASSHGGGTVLSNGTLVIGVNNTLPTAGAVQISGGTLSLGGNNQTVSAITMNTGVITNGTLTGSSFTKSTTAAGTISQSGVYSGNVSVNAGTLSLNGVVAGNVTVGNTAKLSGNGTIAGLLTVQSGGTLSPGNSIGTNRTGALTMEAGSFYNWEFKASAPHNGDYTIVTNQNGLTINGGGFYLYQENSATPFQVGGLYKLIEYSGAIGGTGVGTLTWQNNSGLNYGFGTASAASTNFVTLLIGGGNVGWDGTATNGGNTGNSYWTNALNWGADTAPTNFSRLIFNTFNRTVNTNNFAVDTPYAGMVFSNGAGAFVLEGNRVALVGDIVNYSSQKQTIQLPLLLDTIDLVVNANSGSIQIGGAISSSGGAYGLIKNGTRALVLSGDNTYSGATVVNAGTLVVNGTIGAGNGLTLAANSWLSGTGMVARTLSGAGTVAPGNSPGVLTANQVNPTGGMDFNFEFTSLNLAAYTNFNDVLRLTNAAPFTADLTAANVLHLYIQTGLTPGITNVVYGGFYADQGGAFDSRLSNATFTVHGPATLAYWRTVSNDAFSGSGYVLELGLLGTNNLVIPEPNVLVLWLAGFATYWIARRRGRSTTSRPC